MSARARFITFEGIEGVGKSTQATLLADWLEGEDIEVVRTREPGGAPAAEAIREWLKDASAGDIPPETELLLIFAARAAHAEYRLRPALAAGRWVVCDRFVDASYAYQGGGRELGEARVAALADWLVPDLVPDVTLWLDLPLETARARLAARGGRDRFESEDDDFFTRVHAAYLERAQRKPERIKRIDAGGTPERVHERCRAVVTGLLEVASR